MPGTAAVRVMLVAALLASATGLAAAAAPQVGPQQRVDTNGGTAAASETSGVAGDAAPNEIVATWNDWRESGGSEVIRLGVGLSMDGGVTWDDFVVRPPVGNQSSAEGDPMTAADPRTGAIWVGAIGFSGNSGLFVARKNAGEDSFQPAVMADVSGGVDKCWMVAGRNQVTPDSTRLYIAYNFGVVQSDDLGDTWTSPVSVGSGVGFLPRIGPNGELYVAYWNFNNQAFEVKRSLNGGQSFTTHLVAVRMDNWGAETFNSRFPGTFRVAPLLGLAVDPNDGTLYGVWPDTTDQQNGQANVDVYFSKSVDQGDTWSTPEILNGEGPFVGDQFFPWIETDAEGRLHVVYLDSRQRDQDDNVTNGFFDAYYAYSENGGDTWSEIRLSPQSWNSDDDGLNRPAQFIGDYLGMAVVGDTVWPFYPDTQNGDTDTFTNKISFQECPAPGVVTGLRLARSAAADEITLTWDNLNFVFAYGVFDDDDPTGSFSNQSGTALNGTFGLTLETPADDRYYLVAGRNGCGFGPLGEPPSLP